MAARSLNKVMLIGNMTRDPELRYTSQGTAVCTFGVATNRYWTTDSGEKREDTEFHRIVAWNKLAELCSQLLVKGSKVFVEGRLQTRTWMGQDGAQRTTTEIVINDMIILSSRRPPTGISDTERERAAAAGQTGRVTKLADKPASKSEAVSGVQARAPSVSGSDVSKSDEGKKKKGKTEERKKDQTAQTTSETAQTEETTKAGKKKDKETELDINPGENVAPEDIPF